MEELRAKAMPPAIPATMAQKPDPLPVSSATLQPAPLSPEQMALEIDLLRRRIEAIENTLVRAAPSDRTNQPGAPWRARGH
jgi:hypothetical protein